MNNLFDGHLGKVNRGAVAGSGVSVKERGYDGGLRETVITFLNTRIPLTDEAGVVAYGGLKVYDMPTGVIKFLGAETSIALTKSSAGVNADWDGDFGVGSVTASNNATLSSTEQDIIATTATPQAVAGVTTANGFSVTDVGLDGRTTAVDVFINFLIDDADHDVTTTACDLILNGTLKLQWTKIS